jgi:hypothetical protein
MRPRQYNKYEPKLLAHQLGTSPHVLNIKTFILKYISYFGKIQMYLRNF